MKACKFCGTQVENTAKKCPSCGSHELLHICENCGNPFDSEFCPHCGVKKNQRKKTCPDCGTAYFTNACPNCGYTNVRKPVQQTVVHQHIYQQPQSTSPKPSATVNKTSRSSGRGKKKKGCGTYILYFLLFCLIVSGVRSCSGSSKSSRSSSSSSRSISVSATSKPTATQKATSTVKPTATPTASPTATPIPLEETTEAPSSDPVMETVSPSQSSDSVSLPDSLSVDQALATDAPQESTAMTRSMEVLLASLRTTYVPTESATTAPAPETVIPFAADSADAALAAGASVVRSASAESVPAEEATASVSIPVTKVALSDSKLSLQVPETSGNSSSALSPLFTPENATVTSGSWTSSNPKVAIVDETGLVTALAAGTTKITFTSDDLSRGKKMASCTVTVTQAVTSLELSQKEGEVYVGKTVQLKATLSPSNAANKKVTWTSSNPAIATVSASGQVKGIAPGEVTITAASADGPSASFKAIVKIAPKNMKVSFSAKCIDRNHVGSHWSKDFYINDQQVKATSTVTVNNGDSLKVAAEITENDANPESDYEWELVEITPEIMTKGTTITMTLYVTENGGRYSGNSAEWLVTVKIRP